MDKPNFDQGQNAGVIINPQPEDWIKGVNSLVDFDEINTIANWEQFLGEGEVQVFPKFDAMDCVSQSSIHSVEAQINLQISNNLLPPATLTYLNAKGYIVNGKFRASVRFTAKMSGTTIAGNYTTAVWNSIRKDGLVPDAMWLYDQQFDWNGYYAPIPQNVTDQGKEFLRYFKIQYEGVPTDLKSLQIELKQAPIQLGVCANGGWYTANPIPAPSGPASHAILLYALESPLCDIRDSYLQYNKRLGQGYPIYFAVKGVVQPIKVPSGRFYQDMSFGDHSPDVSDLQKVLKVIEPATNYYGKLTAAAVLKFQQIHNISNWFNPFDAESLWRAGKYCGPKTRAMLNTLFPQ